MSRGPLVRQGRAAERTPRGRAAGVGSASPEGASPAGRAAGARDAPPPTSLALQGGGAHGAFTWGVLDRLLGARAIEIRAITGTSAGAVNAALLAGGHAGEGAGPDKARRLLRAFWTRVGELGRFAPDARPPSAWLALRRLTAGSGFVEWQDVLRATLAPAQLDPFGLNPLGDLLFSMFDFDEICHGCSFEVRIAATRVRDGRPRLFAREELSRATVMASACLPNLFPAVEIDGEAYWDGGYSSNPPLMPFVEGLGAPDVLLVTLNPDELPAVPKSAHEIMNRVNHIAFQQGLQKELALVESVNRDLDAGALEPGRYRRLRIERIDGGERLREYGDDGKQNAHPAYLERLFEVGRAAAGDWLEARVGASRPAAIA